MSYNDELNYLFSRTPKNIGGALAPRLQLPVPVSGAVANGVNRFLGPLGLAATAIDINRRVNKANEDYALQKAGEDFIKYLDNVDSTLKLQNKLKGSPSKFARDVLSVPGINQATINEYMEKKANERLESLGLKPKAQPVTKPATTNKQVATPNINYKPEFVEVIPPTTQATSIPVETSLGGGQGVPSLPILPASESTSGPSNQTLDAGPVPVDISGQSVGGGINNTTGLAGALGLGYKQPITEQWLRYVYGVDPDEYQAMAVRDAQRRGAQALANKWAGTNVTPYQELATREGMGRWFGQGYNTVNAIEDRNRELAEAHAMGQATGLPTSYFVEPRNALAYIVNPLIQGLEQRRNYRTLFGNDLEIQKMKNEITGQKINAEQQMANNELLAKLEMAKAANDTKLLQSFAQGAPFFSGINAVDYVNLLASGMSPAMADAVMKYVEGNVGNNPSIGVNGRTNQEMLNQALMMLRGRQ